MYQGSDAKRRKNPRQDAGWFMLITHFFTIDIFKRSKQRQLEEEDIYEVLNSTKSSYLGDIVETEWAKEKKKNHPSLTKTLFRVFGKEYISYGLLNFLFRTLLVIIKPAATGKLINYFTKNSTMSREDAYMQAGIICASLTIMSFFTHWYYLTMNHLGLKLRAAICALMYRKSLRLTSSSLAEITNGKIVTMMTKDVQCFELALTYAHDVWIGLSQMFVMGYIMYRQIGVSAVLGMGLLFVLLPLEAWVGSIVKKTRLQSAAKTDQRLRRIQELLTSIKLIKLYAWERFYLKITNKLRAKEVQKQRNVYYLNAIIYILSNLSFRLSQYACILLYIYLDNGLTAEKLFIVVTCYKAFQYVFTHSLPRSISLFADVKSAFKRIKHYLLTQEASTKKRDFIVKNPKVNIKNARVRLLEKTLLKDVNVDVASSMLVGVTGAVGAGKSTFLKLVLQDVDLADGSVQVVGGVSYASQEPWLFPGTIRQNILFGQIFDKQRYEEVIKVCALSRDFDIFPERDLTIVNDKGLNLSKGQQARINLARAIYKDCEIYLLDDVMAALDSKVSKYIFDECFKGYLREKICVMVCHNKRCLKDTDRVIVFEDGTIKANGTYEDLEKAQINFGNTMSVDNAIADKIDPTDDETEKDDDQNDDENSKLITQTTSLKTENIYGEHKEEGKVSLLVYKKLFGYAGGWKLVPAVIFLCFVAQWVSTYFEFYVSKLLKAEQNLAEVTFNHTLNYTDDGSLANALQRREDELLSYTVVLSLFVVTLFIELISYYGIATKAARSVHCTVFSKIMGATMYFFDTHLSGNILNRFSKDIGICDEQLPRVWFDCIRMPFLFVCVVAVIIKVNPIVIAPTVMLTIILLYARAQFLQTSRNLRRLDGITRSPVVGFLNSSLEGLTTIRATGNEVILTGQFDGHLDVHSSASYMCLSINRAFGFWLNMIGNVFITFIIFSFVLFSKGMENLAGDVGVAITQAFGLIGLLQWGARQWAELENMMTSVERISEYETLEQETTAGTKPENWPNRGHVEFRNVSLVYPNSDKVVLRDLNFTVEPTQKVGIVGRTGAGKSSIISVLFRLYDVQGQVLIDGVDIKEVELKTLREKISIIPQDPVVFEGTVRSNLDPDGEHKDVDLWNALSEVELKGYIEKLPLALDAAVQGGGLNWSVGQRQLLCLARAILRNNKILVLDEATANIDPRTDALVQKTVRRVFKHCTILTIAHSLGTIIDSDKIMVIDFGSIIEFDSPEALLTNEDGSFYSLVKRAAN